jgi:hypothetical protein
MFVNLEKSSGCPRGRGLACGSIAAVTSSKIHTVGRKRRPDIAPIIAFCSADKACRRSQHIHGDIKFRDGKERLVIEIP